MRLAGWADLVDRFGLGTSFPHFIDYANLLEL